MPRSLPSLALFSLVSTGNWTALLASLSEKEQSKVFPPPSLVPLVQKPYNLGSCQTQLVPVGLSHVTLDVHVLLRKKATVVLLRKKRWKDKEKNLYIGTPNK